MKHDHLEEAQRLLSAACTELTAELRIAHDTHALCDAEGLAADALAQVEAELANREADRRYPFPYMGGASA